MTRRQLFMGGCAGASVRCVLLWTSVCVCVCVHVLGLAGYFCIAGSSSGLAAQVPPGFYAPPGTGSATAYPCPPGQWAPGGAVSCSLCAPGRYGESSVTTNVLCRCGSASVAALS